eukprot:TRINITY_DN11372_c0_g1_i1.p1 TRINITY_DN11372_c0_g1~~TRINITY_DN11372_c0_g1_i1.p1  ORF type:complete len:940 (+),score=134.53 TRINITY_DN11372_c0_g1_i1:39-2822(+)
MQPGEYPRVFAISKTPGNKAKPKPLPLPPTAVTPQATPNASNASEHTALEVRLEAQEKADRVSKSLGDAIFLSSQLGFIDQMLSQSKRTLPLPPPRQVVEEEQAPVAEVTPEDLVLLQEMYTTMMAGKDDQLAHQLLREHTAVAKLRERIRRLVDDLEQEKARVLESSKRIEELEKLLAQARLEATASAALGVPGEAPTHGSLRVAAPQGDTTGVAKELTVLKSRNLVLEKLVKQLKTKIAGMSGGGLELRRRQMLASVDQLRAQLMAVRQEAVTARDVLNQEAAKAVARVVAASQKLQQGTATDLFPTPADFDALSIAVVRLRDGLTRVAPAIPLEEPSTPFPEPADLLGRFRRDTLQLRLFDDWLSSPLQEFRRAKLPHRSHSNFSEATPTPTTAGVHSDTPTYRREWGSISTNPMSPTSVTTPAHRIGFSSVAGGSKNASFVFGDSTSRSASIFNDAPGSGPASPLLSHLAAPANNDKPNSDELTGIHIELSAEVKQTDATVLGKAAGTAASHTRHAKGSSNSGARGPEKEKEKARHAVVAAPVSTSRRSSVSVAHSTAGTRSGNNATKQPQPQPQQRNSLAAAVDGLKDRLRNDSTLSQEARERMEELVRVSNESLREHVKHIFRRVVERVRFQLIMRDLYMGAQARVKANGEGDAGASDYNSSGLFGEGVFEDEPSILAGTLSPACATPRSPSPFSTPAPKKKKRPQQEAITGSARLLAPGDGAGPATNASAKHKPIKGMVFCYICGKGPYSTKRIFRCDGCYTFLHKPPQFNNINGGGSAAAANGGDNGDFLTRMQQLYAARQERWEAKRRAMLRERERLIEAATAATAASSATNNNNTQSHQTTPASQGGRNSVPASPSAQIQNQAHGQAQGRGGRRTSVVLPQVHHRRPPNVKTDAHHLEAAQQDHLPPLSAGVRLQHR